MMLPNAASGLWRAARTKSKDVAAGILDRVRGVSTEGNVSLAEFGLAHPDRVHYNPSSWRILRLVEKAISFGPGDVFVDYGSGKGRVIVTAARYPMKRIIGVELSEQLNAIARDNIARQRTKLKCRNIELVTVDAVTYEPPSDLTIGYFYTPFTGEIFRSVVARIEAALPRFISEQQVIVFIRPTGPNDPTGIHGLNDACLSQQRWLTLDRRIPYRSLSGWTAEISIYRRSPGRVLN